MGAFSQGIHAGTRIGSTIRENLNRDDKIKKDNAWKAMTKEQADYIINYEQPKQAPQAAVGMKPEQPSQPVVNAVPPEGGDLPANEQSNVGMKTVSESQYIKDSAEEDVTQGTGAQEAGAEQSPKLPPPNQIIAKTVLTSQNMQNPDFLNGLAAIAAKHAQSSGDPEMLTKWKAFSEAGYAAKKSGLTDSLRYFLMNDPVQAAAALRRGGMEVTGTPKPVSGKKNVWEMTINGVTDEVDISQIVGAADPDKFIKEFYDTKTSPKDSALIDKYKQQTKTEEEKTKTEREKQKKIKALAAKYKKETQDIGIKDKNGKLGIPNKNLPADAKMVKWLESASEDELAAYEKMVEGKRKITEKEVQKMINSYQNANMVSLEEAEEAVKKILKMGSSIVSGKDTPPPPEEAGAKKKRRVWNPTTGKLE